MTVNCNRLRLLGDYILEVKLRKSHFARCHLSTLFRRMIVRWSFGKLPAWAHNPVGGIRKEVPGSHPFVAPNSADFEAFSPLNQSHLGFKSVESLQHLGHLCFHRSQLLMFVGQSFCTDALLCCFYFSILVDSVYGIWFLSFSLTHIVLISLWIHCRKIAYLLVRWCCTTSITQALMQYTLKLSFFTKWQSLPFFRPVSPFTHNFEIKN